MLVKAIGSPAQIVESEAKPTMRTGTVTLRAPPGGIQHFAFRSLQLGISAQVSAFALQETTTFLNSTLGEQGTISLATSAVKVPGDIVSATH